MNVIQDALVGHMVSSQENILASLDIYQNFEQAWATKVCEWTQKVHACLTSQESSLQLWRNGTSAEGIRFYKYGCACDFRPANTKHVRVYIEFQAYGGEQAILGIYLDKKNVTVKNIWNSMSEFLKNRFPDRYTRRSEYWPCYEKMQAPYDSWVTKDLIAELYDDTNIMLYTPIRELCLATQSFLDEHPQYAAILQE